MMSGGNGDSGGPEGGPPRIRMMPHLGASGSDPDQPQPREVVPVEAEVVEEPSPDVAPRDTKPEEGDPNRRVATPTREERPKTAEASTRGEKRRSLIRGVYVACVLVAVLLTLGVVIWNVVSDGNGSDHASQQAVETTAPEATGTLDKGKHGAVTGDLPKISPPATAATSTPAPVVQAPPAPTAAPVVTPAPAPTATAPAAAASTVVAAAAPPTTHTNCMFVSGERPMVADKYIMRCDEGQCLATATYKGEGVFAFSEFEAYDAPK